MIRIRRSLSSEEERAFGSEVITLLVWTLGVDRRLFRMDD